MRKGISISQPIINNSVDDNYNPLPDIDAKYGPYSSVKEALETLTPELRSVGLTIGVKQNNSINEYWFKSGIEDEDLVEKLPDSDYGDAIKELQNAVFPLAWNSFNAGTTTIEKGNSIVPQISWTLIRKGEVVNPDNASVIENGQVVGNIAPNKLSWTRAETVTNNVNYTVNVQCGSQKLSRNQSYQFLLKKYYGVSNKTTLTSQDILALQNNTWATSYKLSATKFDCTGGKYPYYIVPTSIASNLEWWVGGLKNTDVNSTVFQLTNASGHTESYTVFRLNNIQTGVLSIQFK